MEGPCVAGEAGISKTERQALAMSLQFSTHKHIQTNRILKGLHTTNALQVFFFSAINCSQKARISKGSMTIGPDFSWNEAYTAICHPSTFSIE